MNDLASERRLLELLDDLAGLDAAGREAVLAARCVNDPELRQRAERLFKRDGRTSALAAFPLDYDASLAGVEAGPFTLLEKRGEGGMGTVYRARHNGLGRIVAVKFIRHGRFATEAERRRFTIEQQSLSQLAHPHIVTLFDSGFLEDGQPYFAMEYVDGLPLDRYANTHQLTIRDRIRLFQQVCEAVQHAHDRLIVHRDLKPGNILVLPDGTPRLLDFGIARWLADGEPLAGAGTRILTPDYAAPEQVEGGSITVSTDVYALGVILFELLAGRRPFLVDGSPSDQLRKVIASEPPPPSEAIDPAAAGPRHLSSEQLRRALAGDLDTIVLKAIQKDPSRRYRSVNELSEDLGRHLDGHPVLARPDSLTYRLGKFVRRNRVGLTATTVGFVLLALSALFYAVDITRARQEAERARLRAERVATFTIDLFRPADPNVAQGDTLTALEILDRSSERLLPALEQEPEVLAEMLDVIGEIYGGLGQPAEAQPLLRRAVELRRGTNDHEDLRESLAHLAEVLIATNEVDSALVFLKEADALPLPPHGAVIDLLGHVAFLQARYDDADSLFQTAVAAFDATPAGDDLPEARRGLASALNNLGGVRLMRRDVASSLMALRRARALYQEIHQTPHTDLIAIHNTLGNAYRAADSLDAAIAAFEEGLRLSRTLLGRHTTTATLAINLGVARMDRSCGSDVRQLFEEARAIREDLLGATHPSLGMTLYNQGVATQKCDGDPAGAIPLLEEAERRLRAAFKSDDLRLATARHQLGEAYRENGRLPEALHMEHLALVVRHTQLAEPNRDIGRSYAALGLTHLAAGRPDSALVYATKALSQFEQIDPADTHGLQTALRLQGRALVGLARCDEAAPVIARYLSGLSPVDPEREAMDALRLACPVSESTP